MHKKQPRSAQKSSALSKTAKTTKKTATTAKKTTSKSTKRTMVTAKPKIASPQLTTLTTLAPMTRSIRRQFSTDPFTAGAPPVAPAAAAAVAAGQQQQFQKRPPQQGQQQQQQRYNQKGPMNPFAKANQAAMAANQAVGNIPQATSTPAHSHVAAATGTAQYQKQFHQRRQQMGGDAADAASVNDKKTRVDDYDGFSTTTEEDRSEIPSELPTSDDGLETPKEKFYRKNMIPLRLPKIRTDSEEYEIDSQELLRPEIYEAMCTEGQQSEHEQTVKLPKLSRFNKPKLHYSEYSEMEHTSSTEQNTENAPEWEIKKLARTTHSIPHDELKPGELELFGEPLWSDHEEVFVDESLAQQANAMFPESDVDWSQFESLGTLEYFIKGDKASIKKIRDITKLNSNSKVVFGSTKVQLPRLKPGAKIPRGWMITEDGYCVPHGKESVHFKYADPDLYQTPLHDRLANLVQDKLPKALKMTNEERESMLEVTSSGQHHGYKRHRERMLENTAIDDVIAKINARRGPSKVMDFEENVDLGFKMQNLSPFRKVYRYRMTAQGHALLDIPDSMLFEIRNRKQRSPHRPPGPSMDYTFTSTAYHKGTH